jgi:hypothetical protein
VLEVKYTDKDFNKQVNLTANELEEWLKGDKSKKAGWSKNDGSGEAIGHESYDIQEKLISEDAKLWKF